MDLMDIRSLRTPLLRMGSNVLFISKETNRVVMAPMYREWAGPGTSDMVDLSKKVDFEKHLTKTLGQSQIVASKLIEAVYLTLHNLRAVRSLLFISVFGESTKYGHLRVDFYPEL